MDLLSLLFLGVVIGANNFAVALAIGSLCPNERYLRIVGVFGVFEFFIPLVGIWLGQQSAGFLTDKISWLGPLLLILLGIYSIYAAHETEEERESMAGKVTSWPGLISLAAGLSIDNLIVGFSLGLKNASPLLLAGIICACSMTFSYVGLHLGNRVHRKWEDVADYVAGTMLIGIGVATYMDWI